MYTYVSCTRAKKMGKGIALWDIVDPDGNIVTSVLGDKHMVDFLLFHLNLGNMFRKG